MEALQRLNYVGSCWWCSKPADSAEHKYKRTDIVSEFGRGPYRLGAALVRHVGGKVVAEGIQGPSSSHFKFPIGLCHHCNSTRSQNIDLAYESFVKFVRDSEENILRDRQLDFALAFGPQWASTLADVRRYFVKHACSRIADASLSIGDDLLEFLDGEPKVSSFSLYAEIRTDLRDLFGAGPTRGGSLWLGDLIGWHAPEETKTVRVESHYGFGWLRICWVYDPLARDWLDNMNARIARLSEGRSLVPVPPAAGTG
jgi:hypothetical protein